VKDVVLVAKKCMNAASGRRLISKQEAVVLLGELDLVTCTETVDRVSISNTRSIRKEGVISTSKNFVNEYLNRPVEMAEYSMYDYFLRTRNYAKTEHQKEVIPLFMGISGRPSYPPTEDYAKFVLVVHKPWGARFPTSDNWIQDFHSFVRSHLAPQEVLMEYNRIMQRVCTGSYFVQPVAKTGNHNNGDIPEEVRELIELTGQSAKEVDDHDTYLLKSLDRGKEFNWGKTPKVC